MESGEKQRIGPGQGRGVALLRAFPFLLTAACSSQSVTSDPCVPPDEDGVIGGTAEVILTVSDTDFAVGGADSGSTQRNITIQNSSDLTLTLTNVGTTPHSFVLECAPSGLPTGCPQTSCFPKSANIPAVAPGGSARARFTVPLVEVGHFFHSDVPGDAEQAADGTWTGLVGEFNVN